MRRMIPFVFLVSCAVAQVAGPGFLQYVPSAPSGACSSAAQEQVVIGNGQVWTCQTGTWTQVGGSASGVTSVTGTANQIDVATGTTTPVISLDPAINLPGSLTAGNGASITVSGTGTNNATALNGTALGSLATGIVKVTTGTGAVSNAASGDILTLCITCVTSAAALTSTALMTGGGSQASQTPSATSTLSSGGALSIPSTMSATQYTSTVATGTAPLVVASTTLVTNLNASQLAGKTFAIPNPIGNTTPNTGAFTTLTGTTVNTTTNCAAVGTSANPSVASCTAAAAGAFSCATNASTGTCQVNTTAVTANSEIFVQEDDSLGTRLSVTCNTNSITPTSAPVAARSAGVSFTINLGTITTNPECFSYLIVN